MATVKLLGDDELSPEAKAVFDEIRTTRKTDFVNNFWRALAHDPKTLKRTWNSVQEVLSNCFCGTPVGTRSRPNLRSPSRTDVGYQRSRLCRFGRSPGHVELGFTRAQLLL